MVAINIISGRACNIYALEQNERNDLLAFLLELKRSAGKEYAKLLRALTWTAENGPMYRVPERFKRLNENIFEFKTHGGVRVLCFFDGLSLIILTNGFKKKKEYADDICRAENIRMAYLNAKMSDCLSIRKEPLESI